MEIIEHESMQIVGLQVEAPFDELSSVVPAAWEALFERAEEITGRTGDAFLELSVDLGDGRYRETVGAQVVAGTEAPEGMVAEMVHTARWLHERHHRPDDAIAGTFGRMLDWLADNGEHAEGAKLDIGYGTDGPHDLYVRVTR